MNKISNKEKGMKAEQLAASFLANKGYRIVAKNYRFSRMGEIDLICLKRNIVIVVEVKFRSTFMTGRPEDAMTLKKCGQLRKLANIFVHREGYQKYRVRFDVITIVAQDFNKECEIIHYRQAF